MDVPCAQDGEEDTDDPCDESAVSFDDENADGGHEDDEHRYPDVTNNHCTEDEDEECLDYKMGRCMVPVETSCPKHPHILFPSAPNWESCHMNRFRFRTYQQDAGSLPEEQVICHWLMQNTSDICVDSNHQLPSYPATLDTASSIVKTRINKVQYRALLSTHIKEHLEGDAFVKLLVDFAEAYDMTSDYIPSLIQASMTYDMPGVLEDSKPHYRPALLRWVSTFDSYVKSTLQESSLDQVLVKLIDVAAYETNCTVMVEIRESTARKIVLCGNRLQVQSNIEVLSVDGQSLLQVVTSSDNSGNRRTTDVTKVLPQMACEALAIAPHSPFGNTMYKTVYQLFVQSVHCTETDSIQLHVILIKCFVSVQTLQGMSTCPMEGCPRSSYIMYERLPCPDFHSPGFASFLYKTVKAVLLAFKGFEQDGLSEKFLASRR
ncbi:uncharacterized protein [Ptychodera flava]|uniref:uncharacterized protein n=1 Tax=Ptychodera flava TaxID=63121 RepID=UPI00396AA385